MPFNSFFSWIIKKRIHQIDLFRMYPKEVQNEVFERLVLQGAQTVYGKKYSFDKISSLLLTVFNISEIEHLSFDEM